MKANSRKAGGADELPPASPAEVRLCEDCDNPIPTARLKAMPYASRCVPCLQKSGDVLKTRRYDETTPDGEVVSHHFRTPTPYVADVMQRVNKALDRLNTFEESGRNHRLPIVKTSDAEGDWGMDEALEYNRNREGQLIHSPREREDKERAA